MIFHDRSWTKGRRKCASCGIVYDISLYEWCIPCSKHFHERLGPWRMTREEKVKEIRLLRHRDISMLMILERIDMLVGRDISLEELDCKDWGLLIPP